MKEHTCMNKKSSTLIEILITLTVAVALFTGLLVLINPMSYIHKGNDVARKKDLDEARKNLEQYINDTGCYPLPTQVCWDGSNTTPCHICTKKQANKFSYFTKDICDPKSGSYDYLYQTDSTFVLIGKVGYYMANACPKWFRIYSVLDSPYNAAEDTWGCGNGGCGIAPLYGYSYLVTSSGASTDQINSNLWYCFTNNDCTNCGNRDSCMSPSNECYGLTLYPRKDLCCKAHDPKSPYCL